MPKASQSRRIIFIVIAVVLIISFGVVAIFTIGLSALLSNNSIVNRNLPENKTLRIVSGSENRTLEPLIDEFSQENQVNIEIDYLGSVDILLKLQQQETENIDAIWPASSLILNLTKNENLKHEQSILRSPVILGLKQSKATELGWNDSSIKVEELLQALQNREFKMAMTNATQSNSGLSGYLAFLQAFSNAGSQNQAVLSLQDLEKQEVKDNTKALLNLLNRSSGSSGWLKDLFLEKYDTLDAMINYEALIIETNLELEQKGREPLQAIYLEDGLVVADSPLVYLDNQLDGKEELFLKLQQYLLSNEVQNSLLQQGRRTNLGLKVDTSQNNLTNVFNPSWGIKDDIAFTTLRYPAKDVIEEMLNLYQISLRKPSLTYYVVDVSGSMQGEGLASLKEAMRTIVNQNLAKRYFLQATNDDISVLVPFNDGVEELQVFEGNSPETINQFNLAIETLEAGGGTDIYEPVLQSLEDIETRENVNNYFPAIILMTDGKSDGASKINQLSSTQDIPVFPIMFGDADESQLEDVVEITSGRVFDGRENLIEAFRNAKGYN